jgi:Fic family protein
MESVLESPKTDILHSKAEVSNIHRCIKLERDWLETLSEWPSEYIIRNIHATLFEGVADYENKGISPVPPGNYRLQDIQIGGQSPDYCARALDIKPLMRDYTKELDKILEKLPHTPLGNAEEIIHQAAWAYYTFARIHPFLDGNGRIGRMIAQRIIKGAGFKSLVFIQNINVPTKKVEDSRNQHLHAFEIINKTRSLAALELYFVRLLSGRYEENSNIHHELERISIRKQKELNGQKKQMQLGDIWSQFDYVVIEGGGSKIKDI